MGTFHLRLAPAGHQGGSTSHWATNDPDPRLIKTPEQTSVPTKKQDINADGVSPGRQLGNPVSV